MHPSRSLSLLLGLLFLPFSCLKAVNITVDDASGQMHFSPPPETEIDWMGEDTVHAYNQMLTQTTQSDAVVTFEFNGTAVYVIGSDWRLARPFMANIDGNLVAGNVTGSNKQFEVESTPYWGVTNLTMGEHMLNIITMDAANDSSFVVDALIYTVEQDDEIGFANSTSSSNTTSQTNPASVDAVNASNSSTTAIVGGTIGGVGALGLALFLSVKLRINIIGNLHLGTWRPFSGQQKRARMKSLDVEAAGSYNLAASAWGKETFYLRDKASGNAYDDNETGEDEWNDYDGYGEDQNGLGDEDEDGSEDVHVSWPSNDDLDFVFQSVSVPGKRPVSPASTTPSKASGTHSRPSTPVKARLAGIGPDGIPKKNSDGKASPSKRPIQRGSRSSSPARTYVHTGSNSRPSSPSPSTSSAGRSIRVSAATATATVGSNLRYSSSYEDEPLIAPKARRARVAPANKRDQTCGRG